VSSDSVTHIGNM